MKTRDEVLQILANQKSSLLETVLAIVKLLENIGEAVKQIPDDKRNLYPQNAKLDKLVMQAYGFGDRDDILEKLLTLNLELAEKEKQGEPVIGPWAPKLNEG